MVSPFRDVQRSMKLSTRIDVLKIRVGSTYSVDWSSNPQNHFPEWTDFVEWTSRLDRRTDFNEIWNYFNSLEGVPLWSIQPGWPIDRNSEIGFLSLGIFVYNFWNGRRISRYVFQPSAGDLWDIMSVRPLLFTPIIFMAVCRCYAIVHAYSVQKIRYNVM